jgi:hypothetical protein
MYWNYFTLYANTTHRILLVDNTYVAVFVVWPGMKLPHQQVPHQHSDPYNIGSTISKSHDVQRSNTSPDVYTQGSRENNKASYDVLKLSWEILLYGQITPGSQKGNHKSANL